MSRFDSFRPEDAGDETASYRAESGPRTGLVVTVGIIAVVLVIAAVVLAMRLL